MCAPVSLCSLGTNRNPDSSWPRRCRFLLTNSGFRAWLTSPQEILDLAVSPTDPHILASCSADHSIRLWSLDPAHQKKPLAGICHGQGHKDQVLTLVRKRYLTSDGPSDTTIRRTTVRVAISFRGGWILE